MKHYLLLLKSSDFSKNGNVWTTSYINLYNNNSYSNFSYVRSYGGLNLISDRTYTGIELASPNSNGEDATPISSNAMYVTDAGEVVYDSATPSVVRFLDTSSRIDIISYKHVFVNLPGTHRPGFSIQFYESDQPTGPWLKSAYGSGSGTVLLDNVKPYVKIELTLDDQDISLDEVGLVFYLEVGIHEIVPKNTSKAAREILERFPSWTKIYEDSQEGSTPTLDVPVSVGGKLINSLTGTGLDDIQRRIDLESINSFLASADESILAWAYVSYNIPANVINVQGDSVRLAKVGSFSDLAALRPTDYGYYINNIDGQLITNRLFDVLTIDGIPTNQQAINIYNTFDDFGAKVGLPRLYLEGNANYRKRIYDATANLSGVTEQAFKLALRRELDIWRAEGATPDSEYSGATPEVLDMEHLQTSTPYFSIYGHPERKFIDLIEKINIEYPSNIGYVNWGEGIWDYGGLLGQGISRIPAVYDDMASPIGTYYKPGVGDLEDLKLSFDYEDYATINFNGAINIQGITSNGYRDLYTPVNVDYEVSVGYTQQVIEEASPGAALVYELEFNEFGDLATPTTFYANLSYNNRDDFSPSNIATPNQYNGIEYNFIEIFDQDGYSVDSVPFRRKDDNQLIFLSDSTPSLNKAFFDDVDNINIYHTVYWDVDTQSYVDVPVSDYKFSFSASPQDWTSFPNEANYSSLSSPSFGVDDLNILLSSNTYSTTPEYFTSESVRRSITLNAESSFESPSSTTPNINFDVSNILLPPHATPEDIYINTVVDPVTGEKGGRTVNPISKESIFIPSSPNILYYENATGSYSLLGYFESATLSYNEEDDIALIVNNIGDYPVSVRQWAAFSEQTTPNLYQGYIDQYGNAYRHDEDPINSYCNDDRLVGKYYLSSDSFNLDSESSYIIEKISLISDNSNVIQYVNNINSLVQDLNLAIENSEEIGFDVYAELDPYAERDYKSAIHTGLIDVDEEEYFVFADPKTETFTSSQDFEHDLEFIPRMGHPVLLTVGNDEYRNIFFEDSTTPGKYSFSNTETVSSNMNNIIQLAYKDVHVNYVKDLFTGINIFENIPISGSIFSEFSEATPMLEGHTYEVNYSVDNSFFVDKDYYDEVSDSYMAKLYVSSTPNSPEDYVVTYEKSKENEHVEIDLRIDGMENPLDEGFVYLSTSEHDFDDLDKYLSPMSISDDPDDLMYLTVVSKDSMGNLKPNQSFRVTSNNVSATPEYITTSDNGIGKSILKYSGSVPSSDRSDYILIEGLATSDVNADPNSDTDGYSATVNYSILTNSEFIISVKAAPARYHYDADGTTYVNITGQVYWRDEPLRAEVDIDWYVSDSLISLYSTPDYDYSGMVTSDATGKFVISGEITVNDIINAETRFASLEISDPADVRTIVENLGEVLSDKLITIGGDIIYWNEEYDLIQYGAEITPLNSVFSHMKDENSDLYATPNFVYRHNDGGGIVSINNGYTWAPPQWVPISRFDQYQMGLFGSTPDYIEDYTIIHPDSSEQ